MTEQTQEPNTETADLIEECTAEKLIGTKWVFIGYQGDPEEGDPILEVGEEITVTTISNEDDELLIVGTVANPDFDDSKRKNKKTNPDVLVVTLFPDEVEITDEALEAAGYDFGDEDGAEQEEPVEEPVEEPEPPKETAAQKKKRLAAEKKAAEKAPKETAAQKKKRLAAEKKAAEEAAEEPAGDKDNTEVAYQSDFSAIKKEDKEILEIVGNTDDLVGLVKDMADDVMNTEYRLGGLLYHINLSGEFQAVSDEYAQAGGFKLYCDQELGLGSRKAFYLMNIYVQFNQYELDSSIIAAMGWTKASKIAELATKMEKDDSRLTKKDINKLIKIAGNGTVKELEVHIQENFKKEKPPAEFMDLKFRLPNERADAFMDNIEAAQDHLELTDASVSLETIVLQWMEQNMA